MTENLGNIRGSWDDTPALPIEDETTYEMGEGRYIRLPRANPVTHIEHRETEYKQHGRIDLHRVRLHNGDSFDAYSVLPNNPITDVVTVSSPAWITSIHEGLNKETREEFLEAGLPMDFVSIERNIKFGRSLTRSAANLLEVTQGLSRFYNGTPRDSEQPLRDLANLNSSGISQGGMKSLGVTAIANHPELGINILHSEAIGPCCAQETPLFPGNGNPFVVAQQLAEEAKSLVHLAKVPGGIFALDPRTVDLSPANLARCAVNQHTLRKGEAGEFIQYIRNEQHGHLVSPRGDKWLGQGPLFAERLTGHSNFSTETVDTGGHLSVIIRYLRDSNLDRILGTVKKHHDAPTAPPQHSPSHEDFTPGETA